MHVLIFLCGICLGSLGGFLLALLLLHGRAVSLAGELPDSQNRMAPSSRAASRWPQPESRWPYAPPASLHARSGEMPTPGWMK